MNAWGFGDVRLARVLGPALGYLGWSQMLIGLVLIVFIGAIGVPVAIVFYLFEWGLVASLQAYIFAMLSGIYIGGAIEPNH